MENTFTTYISPENMLFQDTIDSICEDGIMGGGRVEGGGLW